MTQTTAPTVRELSPEETHLAFEAMTELRRGRPAMETPEKFTAWVNQHQRPEGYRLFASFVPGREQAVAAAGFRFVHFLSWGHSLYVDDLVTLPEHRSGGHAHALFVALEAEALRRGCEQLHLDSGHQRYEAHRFYLKHGMRMIAHHFSRVLG